MSPANLHGEAIVLPGEAFDVLEEDAVGELEEERRGRDAVTSSARPPSVRRPLRPGLHALEEEATGRLEEAAACEQELELGCG